MNPLISPPGSRGQKLSDPTEISPPYRETGVAIPLSHCVSSGIADYRCYTPHFFGNMVYRNPKTGLGRRVMRIKPPT